MKKTTVLFLVLTMFAAAQPARADDAVLTYNFKNETTITTLAAQQVSVKRVMTDVAKSDVEAKTIVTLLPTQFSVRRGDQESVYDMGAKMLYKIDHAKKTWQEIPLHAIPLENRKKRAEMAAHALEFETATQSGRYVKTLSGMVLDTKAHDVDLDTLYSSIGDTKSGGEMKLEHRGKQKSFQTSRGVALEFELSEKLLPQSLVKSYNNFLVYYPPLHADVEKALGASSKPFAKLDYKTDDHNGKRMTESWEIQDIALNKGATLVMKPEGYAPYFTSDAVLDQAFATAQKPGPTAENYAERIKGYAGQKDGMRAMLTMNEMGLSLPAEQARSQDKLSFSVLSLTDNQVIKDTMTAINTKHKTRDAINRTNEFLRVAKKQYPDMVYYLDIFRAANIRATVALDIAEGKPFNEKDFGKALKMYENALYTNPWLATVYADLGDAHYDYGNGAFAWICWNQAVRLKPDLSTAQRLQGLKAAVEKEFPEYF